MLMKADQSAKTGLTQRDAISVAVLVFAAVLLSALAFSESLLELVNRWIGQEEYSHGFLIPVIVAWLLWARRDALVASIGRPSWLGPALILLAAVMHILGKLSALFILSQVGFVVALLGIALGVGGYSLLKVTFIPTIFLLFAIPLPYFIDAVLSFRLQLISSQLGTAFIRLLQIPVYLEGNVIDLGVYKLQVVEACSGLRYLYPLMSLGFLAAYLFQAPFWQRAVVFLSTIPITIFMNSLRIGIVGILVDHFGPQDAEGFLHMFEGWIIFLACAGVLVAEMALLARFTSGKGFFEVFYAPKVAGTSETSAEGRLSFRPAPLIVCSGSYGGRRVGDLLRVDAPGNSSRANVVCRFSRHIGRMARQDFHDGSANGTISRADRLHLVRLCSKGRATGQFLRGLLCVTTKRPLTPFAERLYSRQWLANNQPRTYDLSKQ